MYKFNRDLSYDKYGDTYRLKNDQIYIAKHLIKDFLLASNKIHLIILQEDNSLLAVDQFTGFLVKKWDTFLVDQPCLFFAPHFDFNL